MLFEHLWNRFEGLQIRHAWVRLPLAPLLKAFRLKPLKLFRKALFVEGLAVWQRSGSRRPPKPFSAAPVCRSGLCLVGPFCRNGLSAKPNLRFACSRVNGLILVSDAECAVHVAPVAASREVLPGRQRRSVGVYRFRFKYLPANNFEPMLHM